MKKRNFTKVVIASVAVTTALAGCGSTKTVADQQEETVVENAEVTEDAQNSAAENAEPEHAEPESVEPTEQKTTSNWEDPYDAFLAGEGTLSFQYYRDNVYDDKEYTSYEDDLIKCIPEGKEYTLKEFHDALNDAVSSDDYKRTTSDDIEYMGYAFLDCGADGNKELAIRVQGPFVEPGSYMTFVIKEIEEKLEVVYVFAEWSRSETGLYEYGTLYGFGSGGATLHGWDESYINADGKWNYGYDEEEQSELEDFSRYHDHDDYDLSGLDGTIVVYTLRTVPYSKETADDEYYSYAVYNSDYEKMNIPNLYTDSPYQKVMDSHKDITFISMDEMDKIAADKLKAIGVTDKISSGAYLEYKEIDFDKEYVHDISADKYRVFDSIQDEIDTIEALSAEFEEADIANLAQQEANYQSYRWYRLWDGELNDLWNRIANEISEDKKQALLEEQRAWITQKEAEVKEAGADFEGGTMQPFLENCCARRLTRERCYELAAILAEIRGEDFQE